MLKDRYSRYNPSVKLETNTNITLLEGWSPNLALEEYAGKYYLKVADWININNTDINSKPIQYIGYYVSSTGYVQSKDNAVGIQITQGIQINEVSADHTLVVAPNEGYVVYDTSDNHLWLWDGLAWVDMGQPIVDVSNKMNLVLTGIENNFASFDAAGQVKDSLLNVDSFASSTHANTHIFGDDTIAFANTDDGGLMSPTNFDDLVLANTHRGLTNNPHTTTLEQVRTVNSTISGDINFNTNYTGTNVKTPVNAGDIANKQYVDSQIGVIRTVYTGNVNGNAITIRTAEQDIAIILNIDTAGDLTNNKLIIPSPTIVSSGYLLKVTVYFNNVINKGDNTFQLYHTSVLLGNKLLQVANTYSNTINIELVSDSIAWTIIKLDTITLNTDLPIASLSQKGISMLANDGEVDSTKAVNADDNRIKQATTTNRGTLETATNIEALAQTSITTAITPSNLASVFGEVLQRKIVTFTGWDMDADAIKAVAHGITSGSTKIKEVSVWLKQNGGITMNSLVGTYTSGEPCGYVFFSDTNITLSRSDGGRFDTAGFNNAEGHIVIWYTV